MNALKSIFISNFMMLAMGIMGYAGWQLFHDGNPFAWSGVLLTTAPIMAVIGWLMMFKNKARTSARFPLLVTLGAAGVGLAGWAWYSLGAGRMAFVLSVTGWIALLYYVYWYSSFGRVPSRKLKIGERLPSFDVTDVHGKRVSSTELTQGAAILIFYRGNWCPLCVAQVKEMAKRYQEISSLGVRVALISPQPHSNTLALAKKFGVAFDFLTDKGNIAARTLGIALPHGLPMGMQMMGYDSETVLPTVIITDQAGEVIWTHETDNYRIRPEPDAYLDVLRRQGVVTAA